MSNDRRTVQLHSVLIMIGITLIGFFGKFAFATITDNQREYKTAITKLMRSHDEFINSNKGMIVTEYVGDHYVVTMIEGERVLLKRVYPMLGSGEEYRKQGKERVPN